MEEGSTYVHMGNISRKIMRRSIYTFLQYYEYFTTTPALLILPFSASILLSQAISPSPLPPLPFLHACFKSLFHAMGFSPSHQFLSLLNMNLSQTILTSLFTLFLALTSLLIAKMLIIRALIHQKPFCQIPFSSFPSLYKPIFLTQLCNSVLIFAINLAAFSLLFMAFNTLEAFGFSTNNPLLLLLSNAIFYTILANASVICNLALVVSGWENCTSFVAIHKACLLSWTKNSTALSTNIPINLGILAVESLFRYRVLRVYHVIGISSPSLAMEGLLIAYLYSLLIVLDTITSCLFFKSYKANIQTDCGGRDYFWFKIVKKEDRRNSYVNSEISGEIP